ncbi:MAG: AAA family ATPase [Clostridia bacterium]|nr:AAA family ATPase [Clostridia bacterium]
MYIEKLSIESFGSLSDLSYELKSGVNIFRGKNESGKSTLAAFIKFIFYGLNGKTPESSMSEKTRYTNWEHGVSAGSLIINDNGKRYLIERRISPDAEETLRTTDLASGNEVFIGKIPGEVFFGVSEEVFGQTAFSAQGSGSVVDGEKMNLAIDNILFAGDESLDIKGAMRRLDEARTSLLHQDRKGGKLFEMAHEMEILEERIKRCEENEVFLADRNRVLAENRELLEENDRQLKKLEDRLTHYEASVILARFEDLDRKAAALEKARAEHRALTDTHTVNGFLPDDDYVAAMRTLHARMGISEDEHRSLQKQKEAFTQTALSADQRAIVKALDELGGKEKAIRTIREKAVKRKAAMRGFVFFILITLLGIALSLATVFVGSLSAIPYLNYAAYGVAAIGLLMSVVRLATLPSSKEILRRFMADTEEDAIRHMDDALNAERVAREEDDRFAKLMDAIETVAAERAKQLSHARILVEKWGMPCTDRDSLLACIDKASTVSKALKDAEKHLQETTVAYEGVAVTLKGCSREDYQARFDRTAYVGKTETANIDGLKRNITFCEKKGSALRTQIQSIELDIASRASVTDNLDELKETLAAQRLEYHRFAERYKAYLLAYEAIRKSSETLRAKIAPALSKSASDLMRASTGGKYGDIAVDRDMMLSFRPSDSEASREVGFMSAGTKAITYISLRLSLIRLLFRGQLPPTIFDESFAWLDDTRLTAMMSLLKTYSRTAQVIVMTCHDREYNAVVNKSDVNLILFGQ